MLKRGVYSVVIATFLILLGKGFLLFSGDMFGFHDITQAGRVSDFALNLRSFQIPPRIAPSFSFGMGYPIFNHYAPFAYWITAGLHVLGFTIPAALKVSFLAAVMVGGVGMYYLLKEYLSDYAALVGAVLYASSPYMAVEVFVRGNLAEIWFLGLLPVVLYALHQTLTEPKHRHMWFVILALVFSFLMTAHNALSIVGGGFVVVYALLYRNTKVLYALVVGGLLSAYFMIPAVFELSGTHATAIATETAYADHFVYPSQLWHSPHGYGGSTAGCVDGMTFQIGKVLLVLGVIGLFLYLLRYVRHYLKNKTAMSGQAHVVLFVLLTGVSGLLTLPYAQPVWLALEPFLELFQFPWRFLGFFVFGLAFFAAYVVNHVRQKTYVWAIAGAISLVAIALSMPFFVPNPDKVWDEDGFTTQYVSEDYIRHDIAYRVPEYIPTSVNADAWMQTQGNDVTNEPLIMTDGELYTLISESPVGFEAATSSRSFLINKHYAPYWSINLNNQPFEPTEFDELGRPIVTRDVEKTLVKVGYAQTPVQHVANILTLTGMILLVLPYMRLWIQKRSNTKAS